MSSSPDHAVPPVPLEALAWVVLAAFGLCALLIVTDICRGYRQQMGVMEIVWPVTALYLGPAALFAYARHGRRSTSRWQEEHPEQRAESSRRVSVALAVSHCGAGCTLGDIVAETGVFLLGLTVLGAAFLPEVIADYGLALLLGVAFQYAALAGMAQGASKAALLKRAFTADVLSLSAFEVGLFGWMAVMAFVLFPGPHLAPDTASYWFLMQVGMALGFATAWPVNVWLLRRGVKEAM